MNDPTLIGQAIRRKSLREDIEKLTMTEKVGDKPLDSFSKAALMF